MRDISKFLLILIIICTSFLRFCRLGEYPPLNVDEAAIGYNVWSLIQTGKDEHGDSWPLHFKSFGDYKPGGYFYIVLPFVKILGLDEWAVRLPSALMGIATVYLIYLLAKLLWQDEILGLIWAAVLTISPWHLHFSRGGWESNVANFFIVLGVFLFFKFKVQPRTELRSGSRLLSIGFGSSARRSLKLLTLSLLSFVLALYTYHSARVVVPVLVLGLVVFNWSFLWERKKQLIVPICMGVFLIIPLVVSFSKGGATARFSGVGLLADPGPLWRVNELRGQHEEPSSLLAIIFHNRYVAYSLSFVQKYFSHFDGRFLFIDGDKVPRSKIPDAGVMHLFEAPLLFLGIWFWLKDKKEYVYLPFLWLGVAPLASALTFQAPSALRALPMVIPLTFFVAYGVRRLINPKSKIRNLNSACKFFALSNAGKQILNSKFQILSIGILLVFYLWGLLFWWNQYFIHYLKRYPSAWPDFRPVAEWIKRNSDRYERICIQGKYDQPYILTLFYLQYPPEKIQKEIKLTPPDKFGFSTVEHFGKYYFGNCHNLSNVKIVGE